MKHWTIEDIADGADLPDDVSCITLAVMEASKVFGDLPRLVRISRHDDDNDFCRFEVVTELAPGVVLPAEHERSRGCLRAGRRKANRTSSKRSPG